MDIAYRLFLQGLRESAHMVTPTLPERQHLSERLDMR